MQSTIKRLFNGLPFLLAGIAIGYGFHKSQNPALTPQTIAARPDKPERRANKTAPARTVGGFNTLLTEARENRWNEESQARLWRSIEELPLSGIQPALERLNELADIRERSSLFTKIVRRWAELEPRAAFDYLNSQSEGETKAQAMAEIAKVVARVDPEYLAGAASTMPANRARRELVQELTKTWAQNDIRSAFAWAEQLPEDLSKADALAIIRFQWASQNPEEASGQLGGVPPGDSRNSFLTAIAEQWGARDPQAALLWAAKLSDTERALAIPSAIGAWAQQDPLAAGNFVTRLPEDEVQQQAALAVIANWANRDPAQTASWVVQFPEGATREQGIREVVNGWTRMDSEAARAWLQQLPEGDLRDNALKDYVESMAYWAPNKAALTVDSIANPIKREEAAAITFRSWAEIDPATARNWITGLAVPDEVKARLQSTLPVN